jgi:hypothetical protein
MLEARAKKQGFASHGDFRRYLYEAPIFPMPGLIGNMKKGQTELISKF